MRSHAMRLYPLTELHDPKAIELFITEEDANRALGTVCPMSRTGADCFGSARSVCSADRIVQRTQRFRLAPVTPGGAAGSPTSKPMATSPPAPCAECGADVPDDAITSTSPAHARYSDGREGEGLTRARLTATCPNCGTELQRVGSEPWRLADQPRR